MFENHTVWENLELALKAKRTPCDPVPSRGRPGTADRNRETIALSGSRDHVAGSLSHGQKQWLEIGMLLAQDPQLLLVTNPPPA